MEAIRQRLIASAQANPGRHDGALFKAYHLVRVSNLQVGSGGQTFSKGELALAAPDTYELAGEATRAVFSQATQAHVMLPEKALELTPPPPPPRPVRRKPVPTDGPSASSGPLPSQAADDAERKPERP